MFAKLEAILKNKLMPRRFLKMLTSQLIKLAKITKSKILPDSIVSWFSLMWGDLVGLI
jgi:hypothetical protein